MLYFFFKVLEKIISVDLCELSIINKFHVENGFWESRLATKRVSCQEQTMHIYFTSFQNKAALKHFDMYKI